MNPFISDNPTNRIAHELPAGAGVGQVRVAIAELLGVEERRFEPRTIEIVTARRIVEASCSLLDATRIGGGRVIARYYIAPPQFGGER